MVNNDICLLGFYKRNLLGLFRRFGGKHCSNFRVTDFSDSTTSSKVETKPNILYHKQETKYGHHFKNNHHENPDRLDENKEYKAKHETIHLH
jgi:hypothetical protein